MRGQREQMLRRWSRLGGVVSREVPKVGGGTQRSGGARSVGVFQNA